MLCLAAATVMAVFQGSASALEARISSALQGARGAASPPPEAITLVKVAPAFVSPWGQDIGSADLAYETAGLLSMGPQYELPPDVGSPSVTAREAALHYYRQALLLRPSWGTAWARLAQVKASLGQVDSELEQAIALARRLAPYEREAVSMSLQAAMISWPALSPAARSLLWTMVDQALAGNLRRQVVQWSLSYGLSDYVAARLTPEEARDLRRRASRQQAGKDSVFSGARFR